MKDKLWFKIKHKTRTGLFKFMQGGFAEAVQNTNHGSFFTRNCKEVTSEQICRKLAIIQFWVETRFIIFQHLFIFQVSHVYEKRFDLNNQDFFSSPIKTTRTEKRCGCENI